MRLRILVVDDLRDTTDVVCMMLEVLGHDARGAYDGTQALRLFDEHEPQLVIVDIALPDLSGYEVARAFRQAAKGKPVHLVAMTGWGTSADRAKALAAGFDQHFLKPTDAHALNEMLAAATARFVNPRVR